MKLSFPFLFMLLLLILSFSVISSHFLSPFGILIIPVISSLFGGVIVFTENRLTTMAKTILTYFSIGIHDVGIKLFAGGNIDYQAAGVINMMFYLGASICFLMLLVGVIKNKKTLVRDKILGLFFFILLVIIHLEIFAFIGVA